MGQIIDSAGIGGTGHGKIWDSNDIGGAATIIKISLSSKKAKVGETITATITLPDAAVAPLMFALVSVKDRQGAARSDSGAVKINGADIAAAAVSTDATGKAIVQITDPNGIGVKSTLSVSSGELSATFDVTFTVISSPDVAAAQMWGHMDEVVTKNGVAVKRPRLAVEVEGAGQIPFKNELYANTTWDIANSACDVPLSSWLDSAGFALDEFVPHGWPVYTDDDGIEWSYWTGSTSSETTGTRMLAGHPNSSLSPGAFAEEPRTNHFGVICAG